MSALLLALLLGLGSSGEDAIRFFELFILNVSWMGEFDIDNTRPGIEGVGLGVEGADRCGRDARTIALYP